MRAVQGRPSTDHLTLGQKRAVVADRTLLLMAIMH
jgi:hypothetical protein